MWLHTAHPLERDRERDKGCARRTAEDVLEQHAAGDVASHLRRRAFDPVRVVEGVVTQLSLRERSREREGRSKAGEGGRRRSKAREGEERRCASYLGPRRAGHILQQADVEGTSKQIINCCDEGFA